MQKQEREIKEIKTKGLNERPVERKTCNICHGQGYKEVAGGDTIDCPNRSCENGYVKVRK